MKNKCKNLAMYRFTWPMNDESIICEEHAGHLRSVANAIGIHLEIIPLSKNELKMNLTCKQKED